MFDLGWTELLLIGAVALIVVGPKDLPRMMRTVGQYAGKARGMAREFQRSMDDAAREADMEELKDIRKIGSDIRAATNFDFKEQAARAADSLTAPPKTDALAEFEKVKQKPEQQAAEIGPEPSDAQSAEQQPAAMKPAETAPSGPENSAQKASGA
ncbi:MAG: Sec-independent protein translocase protein TatB [Pseudomonadota bacterium]